MPVTEHGGRTAPPPLNPTAVCSNDAPPRRVARCLFGRPDPTELQRMELEVDKEMREHALRTYGVDLAELNRRDDIDTLVVRLQTEDATSHSQHQVQVAEVTSKLEQTPLLTSADEDQINANQINEEQSMVDQTTTEDDMKVVDLSLEKPTQ